jgi:hypothetical protein
LTLKFVRLPFYPNFEIDYNSQNQPLRHSCDDVLCRGIGILVKIPPHGRREFAWIPAKSMRE